MESFTLLLISTVSIAFLHALAPDHWMPFAMIGRARNWSHKKLGFITFLCGIGHVGSSIAIGAIGIILGFSLFQLDGVESARGEFALFLLIGFGIAYALWGLKHARSHRHHHFEENDKRLLTFWALFTVFIFGPCEPLIPLMFLATGFGWRGVLGVSIVFSVITIAMMEIQSLLAFTGVKMFLHRRIERYSHSIAGVVIALTGVFVWVAGI